VPDERRRAVADGYDAIAGAYLDWAASVADPTRDRLFNALLDQLPAGSHVLDLGCGAGVPWTKRLTAKFGVVGVDISETQIELARRNVPEATFSVGDMSLLELEAASFDGIAALYSLSHLPREDHAALIGRMCTWLKPGGLLLAAFGAHDSPDWTGQWLGTPMFFSSYDAGTYRRLLRDAGFDLIADEVTQVREPQGPVDFLWVLARKGRT
jgi:ubiquinone/menaquinone biosynthesis C-methylase UbiE